MLLILILNFRKEDASSSWRASKRRSYRRGVVAFVDKDSDVSCGEGGKHFLTVGTTKVVYLCSKNKDREKLNCHFTMEIVFVITVKLDVINTKKASGCQQHR